jgi:hypothetical protein
MVGGEVDSALAVSILRRVNARFIMDVDTMIDPDYFLQIIWRIWRARISSGHWTFRLDADDQHAMAGLEWMGKIVKDVTEASLKSRRQPIGYR